MTVNHMIHVFGSINIDYSCTVEQLPAAGETTIGNRLVLTPGGKGANQAIAARRAGAEVKMNGAIGTDEVAEQALAFLKADGVNLEGISTVPGPTGCAFVFVDASSENQIVIIPGANAGVTIEQAEKLSFTQDDVVLLQLEVPLSAVTACAKTAKTGNAKVIANLAPYQTLPRTFFDSVDILLLNETEAAQLAKDFSIEQTSQLAHSIADYLNTTVVLTLGAEGVAIADTKEGSVEISGRSVAAVDTVGAGDTFAGYLGTMLAQGKTLEKACEIANKAAALACTKPGAQSAIPTIDELN